jgi:hypothetical protein
MSRKLVTLIKDNPRLPGKHKRVLEAYAAFANNDGTNIYPSKDKVAKKASISRSAVYDNSGDLLKVKILVPATSHTCRIEKCNKGATHYWGQHGKYTAVYNINLPALENEQTYLLLNQLKVGVQKQQKDGVQIQLKDGVLKLDTTQALKKTPAPLGKTQDSCASHEAEGRKEGRKEFLNSSVLENEPQQGRPLNEEEAKIRNAWLKAGGTVFRIDDIEKAYNVIPQLGGVDKLIGYIEDTFRCPKTTKVPWRDFGYWSDSMSLDA